MSWILKKEEFESVISLEGKDRYDYFIKKIADFESLWSIADLKGFATFKDETNNIIFPVWPHLEFAKSCCLGFYSNFEPEEISLEDFINLWQEEFENGGMLLGVFPTSEKKAIIVSFERLTSDLDNELSKY